FLTPLIIVAWRQLWRNAETRVRILPLTLYTVLLFVAMSLFFTFPGMRGGLFHSTTAIWPWLMALAPAGLRQSIQWIAARRPSWQPATAWRVFAPALVVLALALTVAAGGLRGQQDEVVSDIYPQLVEWLPAGATVLVRDPPGFYYHTGHPAISVPNEPLAV
ncbi:MAG: hypothetical protein KDE28_11220, partial [Anaerolineales bacterium]|nr:hypothetical protein [Anaerolineales bacterium]